MGEYLIKINKNNLFNVCLIIKLSWNLEYLMKLNINFKIMNLDLLSNIDRNKIFYVNLFLISIFFNNITIIKF